MGKKTELSHSSNVTSPNTASQLEALVAQTGKMAEKQDAAAQTLADLSGQGAFLRQQTSQLYQAVQQLYQAVSLQCQQLLQSDTALQRELQSFQTGGPQRAMQGVFVKFIRDLIRHLNHLDELVETMAQPGEHQPAPAWQEAVRVARDGFEAALKDWGCSSIVVLPGKEAFSPERHEAIAAAAGEIPAGMEPGTIVKVRRRGWQFQQQVLQYPLVVVS